MDASEASLIDQARGGDIEAFARLVEPHRSSALRIAYVMVGDDAEDVTQEAFVKAFRHLSQFRSGASFRPWLLTIVTNEARNAHRSRSRRSALALRAAGRRTIADATPEEAAVSNEDRQRLLDAVARLAPRDREIVALRYFAGLSEAETAEALGCAKGTAKSRLSRALQRLRDEIGEEVAS